MDVNPYQAPMHHGYGRDGSAAWWTRHWLFLLAVAAIALVAFLIGLPLAMIRFGSAHRTGRWADAVGGMPPFFLLIVVQLFVCLVGIVLMTTAFSIAHRRGNWNAVARKMMATGASFGVLASVIGISLILWAHIVAVGWQ